MQKSPIFEVYEERIGKKRAIFTKALVPGQVYGEKVIRFNNSLYREWVPKRSKLAAAIMKGCPNIFIRKGSVVLYLGAASGTTVSHVSDIVGANGFVFALDFAPRVVRDLVFLCEKRKNIAPLLEDANKPESYKSRIRVPVDIIFQDIAQKSQLEIFEKNIRLFLKKGGYALLALKARSIDVTKKPAEIFASAKKWIEKRFTLIDFRLLSPYEQDHAFFIVKKK